MDEIQIVAPTGSTEAKDHETNNMKVLDFSSHMPDAKTFTLISQSGSNSTKIIFEPNDKLLHWMKMTAPRKVMDRIEGFIWKKNLKEFKDKHGKEK